MSAVRSLAVVASLIGTSALAQTRAAASLDVMSGSGATMNDAWHVHANSRLRLGVDRANAFAYFDGQVLQRDGFATMGTVRGEGGWESRAFGPYRLSFAASAAAREDRATVEARLNLSARIRHGGAWLGAGRNALGDFAPSVGVWQSIGDALFTLTYEPERLTATRNEVRERDVFRPDSVLPTDTSTQWQHTNEYVRTDTTVESVNFHRTRPGLELRGDWARGRWSVSASAMRRMRNDSIAATSAELTLAAALTPTLGLVASGGTTSRAGAKVGEPLKFASIGMRFWSPTRLRPSPAPVRPSATAFALAPLGDGSYRVTLRIPGARTAEISGDFNRWTPVSMRETSAGVWEASFPITSGTHRINVRINGDRWTAPPGVPAVNDEFAGRVGIIIVP